MEALNEYVTFLWTQFQYDWSIFSNPWILYTVLPALAYLLFFILKWFVLLAPVTIPILTLTQGLSQSKDDDVRPKKEKVKDHLEQLLKG